MKFHKYDIGAVLSMDALKRFAINAINREREMCSEPYLSIECHLPWEIGKNEIMDNRAVILVYVHWNMAK